VLFVNSTFVCSLNSFLTKPVPNLKIIVSYFNFNQMCTANFVIHVEIVELQLSPHCNHTTKKRLEKINLIMKSY